MEKKQLLNFNFDFDVANIVEDSRKVTEGSIFVCIKGIHVDGHNYVDKAIENGAKFIFAQREIESTVPYYVAKDTKTLYAILNSEFYGRPQKDLTLIGVTGTDGKTSVSTVIKDMLKQSEKIAYLGTNGLSYREENEYLGYTTPPADILFKKLGELVTKGANTLCMEVSSMALDQRRCETLDFEVAIFTNLTHEHLDVHKTMEHYFESKALLFDRVTESGIRIINIDDEYGIELANRYQTNVVTYSIDGQADIVASNIELAFHKTIFDVNYKGKTFKIVSPLIAKYNVYNLLSAMATCLHLGYKIDELQGLVDKIQPVDGRMFVLNNENITVVVDFAHTPNSLKEIILFAKEVATNEVTVIFGSAGGRDHEKRPLMGAVASKYSDNVIITNDDPRFEDPIKIMSEIADACENDNYKIIESRKQAILHGVTTAKKGDVILITGKGNEDFQLIKGETIYYNDIEEAQKALESLKIKV